MDSGIIPHDDATKLTLMAISNDALQSIGEPYTIHDVIACSMVGQEYVENGCAGICQGCMKAMTNE